MSTLSYDAEESQRLIKDMTPTNSNNDIFKHENESVDLLLKEMNQDLSNLNSLIGNESLSLNNSPTKPLKFPMPKQQCNAMDTLNIKEFSSSSDTYISESDSPKDDDIPVNRQLLERNFNLDNARQVDRTKLKVAVEEDEFSFVTPMTSTVDLINNTQAPVYENYSPSKSIMKRTPNTSPKKNVVFTNSNPEVHHYSNVISPANSSNEEDDTTTQLGHKWNELNNKSSSDDEGSTPPMPPPHRSASFTSILNVNTKDDVELSTLSDLKSKRNSFSNLPLNEKLDIFLSTNQQNQGLDEHLNNLDNAHKFKTDSNIYHLSLNLQNPKDNIENPLESLTRNSEAQLRSSGSSQSSLQSLRDSTRTLKSVNYPITNKGIELNYGIKGYSDHLIESIIPITNQEASESEDESLTMKYFSKTLEFRNTENNGEEFPDSFDRSYNNTEQSIMNLLKSASNPEIEMTYTLPDAHNNRGQVTDVLNKQLTNKERNDEIQIKSEDEEIQQFIKFEPRDEVEIKQESEDFIQREQLIKYESNEDIELIKDDLDHRDYDVNTKLESVSDFGISSKDIKLVKSEKPKENFKQSIKDDSVSSDNSVQFSLRFHMDSDWKLEDSNDGDREDNDEYTNNELTTIHHQDNKELIDFEKLKSDSLLDVNLSPSISTSSSQEFKDASDEMLGKSLAPPKVDEAIDATISPTPVRQSIAKTEDEENVLANSSNIAPPEEITLPAVETNNYSSFDEITKNMTCSNNSYEELLSAEHDVEKKPTNFLSIWHSQEKQKKKVSQKTDEFKIIKTDDYKSSELQYNEKINIPSSLKPKKFKEVNVMSRRVVSPDFEDLHVSVFLPELSEDSGLEKHFKFLTNSTSNIAGNRNSFTPLSTKNVLSNIDDPNIIEPPLPKSSNISRSSLKIQSLSPTLNPASQQQSQKRSRFKVTSFDTKISNITFSQRDIYNDIFEDTVKQPPTIKSHGMKTLPSMDREDVKRILSTKRVISQEEYSNIKLVNNKSKKNSIVNEPSNKYDDIQQHASVYNISTDSSPIIDKGVLPHVADELLKAPTALLSVDQFFNDYDILNKDNLVSNNSQACSRTGSIVHNKNIDTQAIFPDPDPELINSPKRDSNIFKTPTKESVTDRFAATANEDVDEEIRMKYKFINTYGSPKKEYTTYFQETNESPEKLSSPDKNNTPKKKSSPIKIGSPIKLVKNGSTVTAISVTSASPKKHECRSSSFNGDELLNNKLRDSAQKDSEENQHKPSTVSVPSVYTNGANVSGASSATLSQTHEYRNALKPQQESSVPQERGRLFLRVVGFKNLQLPDIKDHNGEFSITLDNGVHCIKTPNYKINSNNILIGKEFELTVGGSLEFILTMKATYDKPRERLIEVRERKVVRSKNRLSRIFGSKDIITTTKFVPTQVKDNWAKKFAQDGSFARCYVDFDQYEDKITGKACTFNLTCFNEWETTINHNNNQPIRCKPYTIGQLEVKMLFIPRTEEHEILPTSIRSAYESIDELKEEINHKFEGYLHQEGGDCEIWKRRFFKLHGISLIAHSEYSHKTRAKINLAKIVDVIYVDKENLNNSSNNYRNFSDVLLLQHAFKIRFANGEIIDFGAPNKAEKLQWISLLEKIVYTNKFRRLPWVKLMLKEAVLNGNPVQK